MEPYSDGKYSVWEKENFRMADKISFSVYLPIFLPSTRGCFQIILWSSRPLVLVVVVFTFLSASAIEVEGIVYFY